MWEGHGQMCCMARADVAESYAEPAITLPVSSFESQSLLSPFISFSNGDMDSFKKILEPREPLPIQSHRLLKILTEAQ